MDIRIIFSEKDDGGIYGHMHHAKNVTLLCDCEGDRIVVENTDGSFEYYDLDSTNGMIRMEDISKGS